MQGGKKKCKSLNWGYGTQVGDSLDDMLSGHRAGAATVLLANEENSELTRREETGMWIERLDELIEVLEKGFEERHGVNE